MIMEDDGWVMMRRNDKGFILDFTWRRLRRDSIDKLCKGLPGMTREQVLRKWKPVKARRTIEVWP